MVLRMMYVVMLVATALVTPGWGATGASSDIGVLVGVQFPGTELSGEDTHFDAANPAVDVRGFWRIADTWGIFADGLWSSIDGDSLSGDVTELGFRIGPELWLPFFAEHPFFITAGVGVLHLGFDPPKDVTIDDPTTGFMSVSLGQRIRLSDKLRLIWEARKDAGVASLDDGPALHFATTNLLAGISWTFGGEEPDADGDGVADRNDRCPDTPAGTRVDAAGCPRATDTGRGPDADGDGVVDGSDRCPETPSGWHVDAAGCPLDTDDDGVPDGADTCSGTPRGATVDARGCPLDGDGDGVPDGLDKCPNTPRGVAVDEKGCQTLAAEGTALVLEGVNFETGSAVLTADSRATLDSVAESLVANAEVRVEIGGHTDSRGGAAMNRKLSLDRAGAVRDYLVSKGVAASRLEVKGYGPDKPVASNDTPEGRLQNRRVELKRIR